MVCGKTIYRWLYAGRLMKSVLTVLRHKGKRQEAVETRGKFTVGKPISQRPKEVRSRASLGHWELDTAVLGRGKSKGCVATFVERKTRLFTAIVAMKLLSASDIWGSCKIFLLMVFKNESDMPIYKLQRTLVS